MIHVGVGRDIRIVSGNRSARAESGSTPGPKRLRPRRPRRLRCRRRRTGAAAEDARTSAAGRSGHDAGIDAAHRAARLRAQNVHLRDGQVVARDDQVEIVLESEIDGVVQREVELAVAHQRIEPG